MMYQYIVTTLIMVLRSNLEPISGTAEHSPQSVHPGEQVRYCLFLTSGRVISVIESPEYARDFGRAQRSVPLFIDAVRREFEANTSQQTDAIDTREPTNVTDALERLQSRLLKILESRDLHHNQRFNTTLTHKDLPGISIQLIGNSTYHAYAELFPDAKKPAAYQPKP